MALSVNQMDGVVQARFPAGETNPALGQSRIRRALVWIDDAATAGTAVGEKLALYVDATYMPNGVLVKAVNLLPGVAIAGDNTDYVSFLVASRPVGGGSGANIVTQTTKLTGGTGSMTAFVKYTGTVTGANARVIATSSITVAATKATSGKAITAAAGSDGDKFGIEIVYEIL